MLDRLISRWASGRKAEAVASLLQKTGIAAAVVQNAEDLAKDPQLMARRFFTRRKNSAGEAIHMDRSALWSWKQSTKAWKAAPRLGQDNHEVFARLLRLPDTE
jgi:crotonobetainyl-CoA:carnitine CoA-transferase CaiB-like acyl-CoA transferase